jgi:hypothetical protein
MRKYYLVRGKKGILVGDPWRPHGFIGQKKVKLADGEKMAERAGDRYEPCLAVVPKHREIAKPLKKGRLEVVEEFTAKNFMDACEKRDKHPSVLAAAKAAAEKAAAAKAAAAKAAGEKGDDK